MEKQILKTLVGSRAHGTHNEDSDYDYRGVFTTDILDFVSPFRNCKTSSWIEGKEDNTSYELSHFCKLCAQGNPSALELLVAPVIEATEEGQRLRALLPKFLSAKRCYDAFRGYSRNQETKFRNNHLNRKWKYAEAHLRTMYQLLHLLQTGELRIGWSDGTLEELNQVNRGHKSASDCYARIMQLEELCEQAWEKGCPLDVEPDYQAIEQFLSDIYLPNICQVSQGPEALESGEKNTSLPISGEIPLSNQ